MAAPLEVQGTVVGRAELAGQVLLTLAVGELAGLAGPGQFSMLRCADGWDPYLRRALPFLRAAGGAVSFLFEPGDPGLSWLARRGLGEPVSLLGPLGQGFSLQPATRHLLLATGSGPLAPLLALADRALAQEVSVSLAVPAATASGLAAIIPEAVELVAAPEARGAAWDLVVDTSAWADQVAVAGSHEELGVLAHLWGRLRPGFVQCYVHSPMACGLGWCGSCLTETRRGPRRACTGGPVFDLGELA